jgi:hypothetical protein
MAAPSYFLARARAAPYVALPLSYDDAVSAAVAPVRTAALDLCATL